MPDKFSRIGIIFFSLFSKTVSYLCDNFIDYEFNFTAVKSIYVKGVRPILQDYDEDGNFITFNMEARNRIHAIV